MKILMLNHEFPPVGGGASPITLELCSQLAKMGHHIDLVTMHFKNTARFEQVNGFNIYRTPAIRKRPNICYPHELATYVPGAFFKTVSLARKNKYDIIHCHFLVPGAPLAWLVSRITGIPFITTCHGTDVPGHNPDRFTLSHKLISPIWRFLAKRSSVLTSPSQALKNLILKNCPGVNVEVIPNGIDVNQFNPQQKTKSILMCSRIFKFKGFQYAIEAINGMNLDWEVNIIGEGPYLPQLKTLAENSKTNIKFWGWIDKKDKRFFELFNKSTIFIFPSEMENFPSVLLEAMAASMAIITSMAGGCSEVVGDTALLVKPNDAGAIRDCLEKLVGSEQMRQQLASAALKRVTDNFSWARIAEEYLKCYRKICNE